MDKLTIRKKLLEIWDGKGFYIFISHNNNQKELANLLKNELKQFGMNCFSSHESIRVTSVWRKSLRIALFSMHACVALVSSEFCKSSWTNQEVGVAIGRKIPLISVKLNDVPPAFLEERQAISFTGSTSQIKTLSKKIAKIFINESKAIDAYICAIKNCESYDHGNLLGELLPNISKDSISQKQITQIVNAFNSNSQAYESFGLNGLGPPVYGKGLVYYLNNWTDSHSYKLSGKKIIKI